MDEKKSDETLRKDSCLMVKILYIEKKLVESKQNRKQFECKKKKNSKVPHIQFDRFIIL